MKKIIAFTLSLIIVLSCMPVIASDGGRTLYTGEAGTFLNGRSSHSGALDALARGVEEYKDEIDLSQYKIPESEVVAFYTEFMRDNPQFFHLSIRFGYYLTDDGKYLTTVTPVYTTPDKGSYLRKLAEVEEEADEILLSVKDGMDDFEKALVIHDRIAEYYNYDLTYTNTDIYTFVKTKQGVCQAYAMFYKYLLDKCGIENAYAESDTENHIWNQVKIDGVWYNVDITWDDPIISSTENNYKGIVQHIYFLNSDTNEYEKEHNMTAADYPCTDKRYESKKYRDVTSSFVYTDGTLYCYKDGINTYSYTDDTLKRVYAEDEVWHELGNNDTYYVNSFAGVALYGDNIIYNTPTAIKAYSVSGKTAQTLHTPDTTGGYIFGMVLRVNTVTYSITTGYGVHPTDYTYTITTLDKPVFIFPFIDVVQNNDWIHKAVKYTYENSLMSGTSKVTFEPEEITSRAMLVQILYNLEGKPSTDGIVNPFVDVKSGEWYEKAIKWAYKNNIVAGTSKVTFDPDTPVLREQFAAILFRYARYKGDDITPTVDVSKYTDFDKTSDYARDALVWANAKKYITGTSDTVIDPAGFATRAQSASILMRYHREKAQ